MYAIHTGFTCFKFIIERILLKGVIGPLVSIVVVEMFNAQMFPYQNKEQDRKTRLKRFGLVIFHTVSLFGFGLGMNLLLTG